MGYLVSANCPLGFGRSLAQRPGLLFQVIQTLHWDVLIVLGVREVDREVV